MKSSRAQGDLVELGTGPLVAVGAAALQEQVGSPFGEPLQIGQGVAGVAPPFGALPLETAPGPLKVVALLCDRLFYSEPVEVEERERVAGAKPTTLTGPVVGPGGQSKAPSGFARGVATGSGLLYRPNPLQ